jgi:hypothetical protein
VVRAAQAAELVVAEPQRGAAVRAELVDQAVPALAVADRDQALGQQLDPDRRAAVLGQLLGQQGGDPVAPEQGTHLGARAGAGQEFVDVLLEHLRPPLTAADPTGTRLPVGHYTLVLK